MSDNRIRVVVADDFRPFREGVVSLLKAEPDFEIVGQGDTADDAIRLAMEHLPDLILLDITMPGGGLQAAQAIAAACPVTKIVMLTAFGEEEDVTYALKVGAQGYILKDVAARELVRILRAVWAGETYVTPALGAGRRPAATRL